jgi:hypothetical protein
MPVSSVISTISLSEICFPDITGKTIQAWGQVSFTPGTYVAGGLLMGLIAYADARTVDFNGFLRCSVFGEDVITSTVGGYSYHYSPVGDVLQVSLNGVELATGAVIPAAVLNDTVLFLAVWNRTTVLG